MRLRNVTGAKETLFANENVVNNPTEHKGKWHEVFNNDHDIHLEIGMGKGDFIIEKAIANPNINYLGIEKYDSVLVRAIEKLTEPLPNLKLIRFDATYIDQLFDGEISLIYLNHSDPWPKDRHAKRRLTSPIFLKLYQAISKGNVNIDMRTDNQGLFNYSKAIIPDNDYQIIKISEDYKSDDGIMTEYERKFRSKNQPIYYIRATYVKDKSLL